MVRDGLDDAPYYAACLDLRGRGCAVVGGGKIAARKAAKLLESGASVKVISPKLQAPLSEWAAIGKVEWINRSYQSGDVKDAWMVIAATDDKMTNQLVASEAEQAGRLVNVVDDVRRCNFIVPASVRRGILHFSISTSGTDPAAAKRLRRALEADLVSGSDLFQKELQKLK